MKITKKQWIIGASVALVLAGGSAGVVANNQAQAQAEKMAQEAKTAHDNLIKAAEKATAQAETFKNEADVKTAQAAIKKLEDKDKSALISRVENVQNNWDWVKHANKVVVSAEKTKTDASVKTAQTAIDKLKSEMTKSKKAALQKRLDTVKKAIQAKKEKAEADKKSQENMAQAAAQKAQEVAQPQAEAANNTAAPQSEAPANGNSVNYEQNVQTPSYNAPAATPSPNAPAGGGNTAPSNPPQNSGNSAYNNGGGANANPNVSGNDLANDENWAANHPGGAPSANGGR
jgi:colicin import membrane protein